MIKFFNKKINRLEKELNEERKKYKCLEDSMTQGERALKKKVNSLETNLEQLSMMYHQLLSQRSVLKVDNQVLIVNYN